RYGLASITMSQIAKETGIGRATLYKYFSSVEAILLAWHERQIGRHLELLVKVRDRETRPGERLAAVLEAYALFAIDQSATSHTHDPHSSGLADALHQRPHAVRAQHDLSAFIRDLLVEAAEAGNVRSDVASEELASYCINALAAATTLSSRAAVLRLVAVTLDGLSAPPPHTTGQRGPGSPNSTASL
ncbi:MAG: TetR/AcrR family transcriptional regulator, partial [Tepidiformaceae bacterium]